MSLRARAAAALLAGLTLLCAAHASAQADEGLLRAEFWADAEPVPGSDEEWPVGPDTARGRILEEAAWVFGGMVYGFEFTYAPYDKTRGIEERFDLSPIHSISAGEVAAETLSSSRGDYRAYASCRADASLSSLMESYDRDPWKGSQGVGRADIDRGVKGRKEAYVDALRLAVRSCLQGLEPNKPRLVRGRVVLDAVPSLSIIGGFYTAQVRARVMVVEVVPYKVY